MIWKRIEIVYCFLLLMASSLAGPACAASAAIPLPVAPTAQAYAVDVANGSAPRFLPPPASTLAVSGDPSQELIPDIPYSYFWNVQDGLSLRVKDYARQAVSEHSPGLLGGFEQPWVDTPGSRWLARPSEPGWAFGTSNWSTQLDGTTELALGSSEIAVPEWNERFSISGISLSQSFMASSDDVAKWNYSLAFGAVDQSSSGSSDLAFGPTAGSLALNYDYSPNFSVETHTEVASDLIMSGVTGQYDLGWLGRWRSGIARSNQGVKQGWRYRAMADFDVADDMSLGWVGERYTDGFMDIRRYAAGSNGAGGGRQRWSASWDTDSWGRWSGTLETVHNSQGTQQRRFGLNQQFWYSPNLRIGIHAERETISDDYDIGLRFSFPLY